MNNTPQESLSIQNRDSGGSVLRTSRCGLMDGKMFRGELDKWPGVVLEWRAAVVVVESNPKVMQENK